MLSHVEFSQGGNIFHDHLDKNSSYSVLEGLSITLKTLHSAFLQSTQPTLLSSFFLTTFLLFPNISAALALEMNGQGEASLTCVCVRFRAVIPLPLETGRDA